MAFLKLTEQNVQGKTVLIRADMNVPFKDGNISDDTRIRASLASIKYCLDNGASVIVMTHLGRPTEGEFHPEDDVAPVAAHLGKLLGKDVKVLNDWRENKPTLNAGDVVMLQNVRINKGEKKNDLELGKAYASLCDVFVNDAFGTAHRAQASTEAVAQAAIFGRQSRPTHRRRRHCQYLPVGRRQSHRQIFGRTRFGGRIQKNHGENGG